MIILKDIPTRFKSLNYKGAQTKIPTHRFNQHNIEYLTDIQILKILITFSCQATPGHILYMKSLCILLFFILPLLLQGKSIYLNTYDLHVLVANQSFQNSSFFQTNPPLDCGMPQLFIFGDSHHISYSIQTRDVLITSVGSRWGSISSQIFCDTQNNCKVKMDNQCDHTQEGKHQINWIKIDSQLGQVQYLVDCNPGTFYKPFQTGLLLLIILSTITVTLSALYSKAWSYHGYGYPLTYRTVVVFNILLIVGVILGYLMPVVVSRGAQILGSLIGAAGVTVCASELIWLTKDPQYRKPVFKALRKIDIISGGIGLAFIPLYWLLNGHWFINDIMAVCSIVALMKILKIQSLSVAAFLIFSLLAVQIAVGLIIHYLLEISYNNYIINRFQNPLLLVFPSLTPQLFRQCAWLPISSILFPGLLLSYLRRFDKTRATVLYLLIGLISFYIGSLLWMFIDKETVHSLPFAIISEPLTILITCLQSFRRNEFRILWRGTFHDQELTQDGDHRFSKETEIVTPTAYKDLTANLRMSDKTEQSEDYRILQD